MPLPAEAIVERRRLSRKLVIWRSAAAFAAALAIVAWAGAAGFGDAFRNRGAHVATLGISGVIVSDPARQEALAEAAEADDVKAVILVIDSPGGTFVGSDDLFRQIRAVAAEKPVVAVINNVAASGGFMAAIAADRIFARRGSITASVGVIFQSPRVNRLMDYVGVDMDTWRSGPLKALPSPFEPPPPAAAEQAQAMVDSLFGIFLEMVRTRRNLGENSVAEIRDGRVVTGQHALELGLIDALGDIDAARGWLAEARQVSEDLPEQDITPPPPYERDGVLESAWGYAAAWLFGAPRAGDEIGLSGLLALWRPLSPLSPGDRLR